MAALLLDFLRVVHRHSDVTGQGLEKFDLRLGKGIEFVVCGTEHADHAVAHLQRNEDLRAGLRFARVVVQFLRDIGSVVRPAGD